MNTNRGTNRRSGAGYAATTLTSALLAATLVAGLSGCQTFVDGQTLPSGHYLKHPPQYIPESPPFPLSRELAYQESVANAAIPGEAPPIGALPAQVPPGGMAGPGALSGPAPAVPPPAAPAPVAR